MYKQWIKQTIKTTAKLVIAEVCTKLPARMQRIIAKTAQYTQRTLGGALMPAQERLTVAIFIAGAFGDALITLAWIKELHRHFDEEVYINVYGRIEHLPVAAYMHSHIANIFDNSLYSSAVGYDLKLRVTHFCLVDPTRFALFMT